MPAAGIRAEFRDVLTDLLFSVQELSLLAATTHCGKEDSCELCKKAKEIAGKMLEMLRLQRALPLRAPAVASGEEGEG